MDFFSVLFILYLNFVVQEWKNRWLETKRLQVCVMDFIIMGRRNATPVNPEGQLGLSVNCEREESKNWQPLIYSCAKKN